MTDRPIIFSAPMIRALLDGRKSQTRRKLPGFQPSLKSSMRPILCTTLKGEKRWHWRLEGADLTSGPIDGIRFAPGDRLWVRETWTPETDYGIGYPQPFNDGRPIKWTERPDCGRYWTQPHYRATDPTPDLAYEDRDEPACRWRSPIHMPRWASRLTLTVSDVRVQRLQEISEEDAIAEGVEPFGDGAAFVRLEDAQTYSTVRGCFAALWRSIHGLGAWEQNPWVCAVSFDAIRANIDEVSN